MPYCFELHMRPATPFEQGVIANYPEKATLTINHQHFYVASGINEAIVSLHLTSQTDSLWSNAAPVGMNVRVARRDNTLSGDCRHSVKRAREDRDYKVEFYGNGYSITGEISPQILKGLKEGIFRAQACDGKRTVEASFRYENPIRTN